MSKYFIFVNMKSYLILTILGFTHLVICLDLSNFTYDDSYPVCSVNLFRKKREHTEYTRWRANLETTPEFIVKVLDEDMTTSNTKQIVAINIQPVTKGSEKIIVGGVIVPPVTSHQLSDMSRDYTRFVPPATVPITRLDEGLYLAPATPRTLDKITPIRPKGRMSQRDESPPASPQFLARTPTLYARQYAPIAPVVFTRRATISPLRPPTSSRNLQDPIEISTYPKRTSVLDILWPTRTEPSPNEFKSLHNFVDEVSSDVTRTTFHPLYHPIRTITTELPVDEDNEIRIRTETSYIDNRRLDAETQRQFEKSFEKNDKDSDVVYNMMFYSDEDVESISKKNEQDQVDNYDGKNKIEEDTDATTEKELTVTNTVLISKSEAESITDTEYVNSDETNITLASPSTLVIGVTAAESTTQVAPKEKVRGKRRPICNLVKLRQLNFNSPQTLPEIASQLKQWAENSPLAKWEDITNGNLTTMENPIYMMIVDDPSSGQIVSAKQTVMIVAGIQGRDHHAVAAAMYVLYQLIERSEAHADLLTKYRFWIIPVFNPDGYDYSMTFPHRREWSKNLRQNWDICKSRDSCSACDLYGLRCTVQPCYGVNLDRNFEYQWIPTEELRAEHPCGSLHAGARQLSEAETWALTHYLHEQRAPLFTFIAFKEGEVLGVLYPYSHTRKLRAFDHVYRQRASRASAAANSISGRPYVAGQTSEFLPLYAGGIEDWVDGHLGIDNTYTIMMFRPTDSYNSKLITERVVHEAYAAMDTLLLQSIEPLGPPPVTLKRTNTAAKTRPTCPNIYFIMFITNLLFSRFTSHTYK